MKAFRITLLVDEGWLNAINEMCSYVEYGEVCFWEDISEPFEIDPAVYNMTDEEFEELLSE